MNQAGQAQPPPQTPPPAIDEGGVPLWLPLLISLLAIGIAAFVATRICPTLSAIVSPPDPILPAGAVLESRESKGTEDQWLYTTKVDACEVAKLYQDAWGACVFDPSAGCNGTAPRLPIDQPFTIARCAGKQQIAQFNIQWSGVITRNGDGQGTTYFRVYREVN
jgi:hypothetical protein